MADNAKIVTDEVVAQVAERLTAAGEKVSNRAVWSEIGGGSMTTISGALRRWRERQELQPEQKAERAAAPDDVYEAARLSAEQIWAASQRVTQHEIDDLSNTMNERINKANAERDAALVELQGTVEELQLAQATIIEQAQGIAAAVAEAERLIAEVAQLKDALAAQTEAAHTAAAALAEAQRHADRLSTVLDQERAERAAATQRAATAEQQAAELAAKEESQRNRANELTGWLQRVEQRAEALDQRVQAAEGEAKEAIREAGNQRTAAEAARSEATEARHEAREAQEASRVAQAAADELRNQLAALKVADEELAELVAAKKAAEKNPQKK